VHREKVRVALTREQNEMLDRPICARPVDRETAPTTVHEGASPTTSYFRCARPKARFDGDPTRYLHLGAGPVVAHFTVSPFHIAS